MMKGMLYAFLLLAVLMTVLPVFGDDVPGAITYQGKLTDKAGQPVPDGDYNVRFYLFETQSGGTAFWSTNIMTVTTKGGVFTARLERLSASDLKGKREVWLETWVGDPPSALSPRVRLDSVPYALRAGDLTLPYSATESSSSTLFSVKNTGTGSAGYFGTDNPSSFANAVHAYSQTAGNAVYAQMVGTGIAGRFEVANPSNNSDALRVITNGVGYALNVYTNGSGHACLLRIDNSTNANDVVNAQTNGTGDALYGLSTGSGNAVYGYNSGTGRAGFFYTYSASNTSSTVEARTRGTGSAGRFEIQNTGSTSAAVAALTSGRGNAVYGESSGNGAAVQGLNTGTGRAGYFKISNASSSEEALYVETNGPGFAGSMYNTNSGNYALFGSTMYGVFGRGAGDTHRGVYGSAGGANGYGVYGYASGENAYAMYANATGTYGVGIYASGGASGWAADFRGNVRIRDESTGSTVIELGKGLDYAEGFDVSSKEGIGPGSVLVIDTTNPGKLALSRRAYDRRVAGIVAGAKKMGSGVRLGAGGFDYDVALAGRVYCNVDATVAGIEPGDLLTTSSTPGYAMKVTDYSRAQGAILGKAMEALKKGTKGQILVLVTLQ